MGEVTQPDDLLLGNTRRRTRAETRCAHVQRIGTAVATVAVIFGQLTMSMAGANNSMVRNLRDDISDIVQKEYQGKIPNFAYLQRTKVAKFAQTAATARDI